MGHKKLCINCRVTLNITLEDKNRDIKHLCPSCSREMTLLPHRFRPPKKTDDSKWKTVEFLLNSGFRYEHWIDDVPENLRDAKEFIKKREIQLENYKKLSDM